MDRDGAILDPEKDFNGDYVGIGSIDKTVTCPYNIRKFSRFSRETGREWNDLTEKEKDQFKLCR